ncbi:DUF5623 domain-containing protein [Rhodanobacter sp. FDAARGOS 1247]|uniref:DUF5623 domain-containing protein n=1 Tax=Rhodanobacter sp. FDAARGOS 1247 TaxID=2778082 RepID=UPI001952142D|nr:DUF5623 domain-containing protein [Rhodanobacter sp. FDAARGOS 1247]QRP64001.1 DUF5623 domain-containing protein [Rhodanobacter sp. FDAARGOS 1247]
MYSVAVPPSSVDGIKRLAKTLKRERSIPHHQALEEAARIAGFENLRHAQRQLESGSSPSLYPVFLTAYWREKGRGGRETLRIELPTPLPQIVRRNQLNAVRQLAGFRLDADDHLERKLDVERQDAAQHCLHDAADALRFMVATGLVPVTTQAMYRKLRFLQGMPGHDHPSEWLDEVSGSWLYMDEPYKHHGPELLDRRRIWVRDSNLFVVAPEWEGLYAPGRSVPYLVSADSALLARVTRQVATLSAGTSPLPWAGESDRYGTGFLSPARKAASLKVRRRPMPAWRGEVRHGATPYSRPIGGAPSRWRPAVAMPIEMHLKVGPLLHGLCNSKLPKRVHDALSAVRCELDNWVMAEYPGDAMSQEQFLGMYYGEYVGPIDGVAAQLRTISEVHDLLRRKYADCPPLKSLLKHLERARIGLEKSG